jgi:hypothetical protein
VSGANGRNRRMVTRVAAVIGLISLEPLGGGMLLFFIPW